MNLRWLSQAGIIYKPIQYFFMLRNIEGSNVQFSKKQSFFRNKIRRQQINTYFQQRRKEFSRRSSAIILSSQTQKEYFLQSAYRRLINGDEAERFRVLSELKDSVVAFTGQFDLWVEGPLTGILLNAFQAKEQLREKVQVAKIFINIIQSSSQIKSKWMQFLQTRKIHQLLTKCLKSTTKNSQKQVFLQLLGCLCRASSYLRDWIVVSTQQQLINYGEFLNYQGQESLLAFLSIVVDYLAIMVIPENIIRFPPVNFVIRVMPLLMRFLVNTKEIKVGVHLLMTIRLAVKSRNEIVFSHFRDAELDILFNFLRYEQTKLSSLNLINYISSSSSSRLAEEILRRGIVDFLEQQIEHSGRERNILKISFNIMEHLTSTEEQAFALLGRCIWREGVLALTHAESSVREEAYYFIEAILNALDNPSIQMAAIKKGGIISIIMQQLSQTSRGDITLIAMRILQLYLRSQAECTDPNTLHLLQTVYRFSQVLDDVYMRSCRPDIQSKAEVLSQLFAQAAMRPYTQ